MIDLIETGENISLGIGVFFESTSEEIIGYDPETDTFEVELCISSQNVDGPWELTIQELVDAINKAVDNNRLDGKTTVDIVKEINALQEKYKKNRKDKCLRLTRPKRRMS